VTPAASGTLAGELALTRRLIMLALRAEWICCRDWLGIPVPPRTRTRLREAAAVLLRP
jgi:hypothetical protein